jgi:hypothetical protein
MYVGLGDLATGEQCDIHRMNPQRLDNLNGTRLRILAELTR